MAETSEDEGGAFGSYATKINQAILELQASSIIDKLTLKFLMAEVASEGRTAREASEFLAGLRAKVDNFLIGLGPSEGTSDLIAKEAMRNEVNLIFGGIAFEENK